MSQMREMRLSRGNRSEVVVLSRGSEAVVEKRLLDFANVSTERTALYIEALLQKAASGPGVVPIVDERFSHVTALRETSEVPAELDTFQRYYVRGHSLRELCSEALRHHLTKERCLLWMATIAAVLHRVHNLSSRSGQPLGLIHRDVTWDNILIAQSELSSETTGEGVFLNDFGLAHVKAWGKLSHDETLQGAPRFLSPELRAGGLPSRASDVYQTALTLCFLLNAKDGKGQDELFEDGFQRPASDRARALLRPLGAEACLCEHPENRPTALELAALLSK